MKIDPCRRGAGIGGSEIHRRFHHAAPRATRAVAPSAKSRRDENDSDAAAAPRAGHVGATPACSGECLQEPDLRDYQDLPNVDRAQFVRIVGSRPTRFEPAAVGRFEWLRALSPELERAAGLGLAAHWRGASHDGGDRLQRRARASRTRHRHRSGRRARGRRLSRARSCARSAPTACPKTFRRAPSCGTTVSKTRGTLARGATVQGKPVDVIAALARTRALDGKRSPRIWQATRS